MALQLRPNCEYCDKDLPPHSLDARICSFECTFCAVCAMRSSITSARTAAADLFRGRSGLPTNGGRAFSPKNIPLRPSVCTSNMALKISQTHCERIRDIPPEGR